MTNPYAPPTVDENLEIGEAPTYRSSRGLSVALRALLGASVASSVLTIGFSVSRLDLFERIKRGDYTIAEAEASDAQAMMVAGLFLVVYIATAITWIVWQRRTSLNARALGATDMQYGPNAWGWFFCPFINLYRPLVVVRELWQVNDPTSADEEPGSFGAWWVTWIIGSILSRVASRIADEDATINEFMASIQFDMAANVMLIISALFAIKVIAAVHGREHARARGGGVPQS